MLAEDVTGPGKSLQHARERAGISLEDVASRLRVSGTFVQIIERDAYDIEDDNAMVIKCLKAYASLVQVDPNKVLSQFNALLDKPESLSSAVDEDDITDHQNNKQKRRRYVLSFLTVTIAAGLYAYTHHILFDPTDLKHAISMGTTAHVVKPEAKPITLAKTTPPPVTAKAKPAEPVQVAQKKATAKKVKPVAKKAAPRKVTQVAKTTPPSKATKTVKKAPVKPAGKKVILARAEQKDLRKAEAKQVVKQPASRPPEDLAALKIRTQPKKKPLPTVQKGSKVITDKNAIVNPIAHAKMVSLPALQLKFTEDCWANIQDATGKQLAYGMMEKGKVLSLKGKEPYKLLLGNIKAVQITLHGKPMLDTSTYPPNRVARLIIGNNANA